MSDFESWQELETYLSEGEVAEVPELSMLVRSHYIQYGCDCCGESFSCIEDTVKHLKEITDISGIAK